MDRCQHHPNPRFVASAQRASTPPSESVPLLAAAAPDDRMRPEASTPPGWCNRVSQVTAAATSAVRARGKDSARAAIALFTSSLFGLQFTKGFWTAVTVAMVLEAGVGASARIGALRLQGSVVGAFFGFVVLRASLFLERDAWRDGVGDAWRDGVLLLAIGVWVYVGQQRPTLRLKAQTRS